MVKKGIGARLTRKEDRRFLRGRGEYTSDLNMPGTQDAVFVRSPVAHATITSIEAPPNSTGSFFTAADFPNMLSILSVPEVKGFNPAPYPPLATDKVRFVGETIAVCVAPTRAEAEDMAANCICEFDELPAVVDADIAMRADAPRLHDTWDDNYFIKTGIDAGDVDAAATSPGVEKIGSITIGNRSSHSTSGASRVNA